MIRLTGEVVGSLVCVCGAQTQLNSSNRTRRPATGPAMGPAASAFLELHFLPETMSVKFPFDTVPSGPHLP